MIDHSSRLVVAVMAGLLIVGAVVVFEWNRGRKPGGTDPDADQPVAATGTGTGDTGVAKAQSSSEAGLKVLGQVPQFELINQFGQPFGLWKLEGKVWVANCITTRSSALGPRQTEQLKHLAGLLRDPMSLGEVHFVTLTAEPEHDTADTLHTYSADKGANLENWSMLTGPREEIARLCREGLQLPVSSSDGGNPEPLGEHPGYALVDALGRVRGYYDSGSEDAIDRLREGVQSLLGERLAVPAEILDPPWLEIRRREQIEAVARSAVFHDFHFFDRFVESGIRFRHRCVEDAGKTHKPVHYDHGNGMAVADVDADGLVDVFFTTQLGRNELWKNLGNGKFANVTDAAGLGLSGKISVTASFADVDNDGDADLYVTTVKHGNRMFQNDGQGVFADITASSGLGHVGHSSGSVFFDYDRDGLLDLFLCNVGVYTTAELTPDGNYVGLEDAFAGHLKPEARNERSLLFKNVGQNRFEDVTEQVGLHDTSWTGDASPLDVNRDGWIDLYVLNMQGHDQYYENVGGKSFVSKGRELFPKTSWGSMGIGVFDFDNDLDLDIFVTDMHSDMSADLVFDPQSEASLNTFFHDEKVKSQMRYPESLLKSNGMSIYGNAFYRNDGEGKFVEISDQIGAENYWPWGLSLGDFNADGFEDVFIASSMNYPFRYGVNSLLLNERGERFIDSEFAVGIEPRRGGRTAKPWFGLDCNGADRDHKHCKDKNGQVIVWSSLGTRSSAVFDLDDDGDLDIVTNEFNDWPMVLVSDLAQRTSVKYLKVKLVGKKSNRGGLGARVELEAGNTRRVKVLDGKSGYLSQSLLPLYFGLNGVEVVDQVHVTWPSGMQQTVAGPIPVNQTIEIQEPDA